MNKLDQPPAAVVLSTFAISDLSNRSHTARRMLVLISEAVANTPYAARRIVEVATAFKSPILFLGLCKDKTEEADLRRQLITLSTMVGDANVPVESKIELGKDWLNGVAANLQEGDVLVYFSGRQTGSHQKRLEQLIQSDHAATIYLIPELVEPGDTNTNWIRPLLAWAGSIGIILGFLWLQIKIDPAFGNWPGMLLLIFSILAEFLALWVWNSLLG